jgi:DNA-binding transcriptional LysR family regulator
MNQSIELPGHDVLRTFVVLVSAGSQSAAARALGLSVPTVSLHVRALERALGLPLFEKIGRRAVPTEAARSLALRLGDALAALGSALEETLESERRVAGVVRIGAPRPFGQFWLTPRLGPLMGRYPELVLDVSYGVPSELEAKLREGALDLALLVRDPERTGLEVREVHRERFLAVASPEQVAGADLRDASSRRWIAFDEDLPMLLRWWRATFGPRARPPAIAAYVRDLAAMRALVEAGVGMAVLPDYVVATSLADHRLREVYARPGRSVHNAIALAWRASSPLPRRHALVLDALAPPAAGLRR